jgi:hypothetical protein
MSHHFSFYKVLAIGGQKRALDVGNYSSRIDGPHKKSAVSVLQKLPLGHDDFETIVTSQSLYIDKTKHIYELVENPANAFFFLSRMRRSGKSLALSTLKALFEGKRHLFEGLYISQTNYDFKVYPIVYLNMSKVSGATIDSLNASIKKELGITAQRYGINITKQDPSELNLRSIDSASDATSFFADLVRILRQQCSQKVVILIDEYDAPIINYIHTPEVMDRNNAFLKDFYKVLKHSDPDIRFSAVFGISNFAKSNMYSGLNHLDDLSKNIQFADFCGITVPELLQCFRDRLDALSLKWGQSVDQLVHQICYWYDGYSFLPGAEKVLNPFSTMSFFKNETFDPYWFHTGTTDFLVSALGRVAHQAKPEALEGIVVSKASLFDIDLSQQSLIPIMFQAGYLTFLEAPTDWQQQDFKVGVPNNEVRLSFYRLLLKNYSKLEDGQTTPIGDRIQQHIRQGNVDSLVEDFRIFFSQVPYTVCPVSAVPEREAYYQSLLFVFLKTLGHRVEVEITTNTGRIDCIIQTKTRLFLMEFKLNRSAEEALAQIKDKHYMTPFEHVIKEIHMIGINFSSDKDIRNITQHLHEVYHTQEYKELRFQEAQDLKTAGQTGEAIAVLRQIYRPQIKTLFQATVGVTLAQLYEQGHSGFAQALPFYQEANTLLATITGSTETRIHLRANAKRGEGYCLFKTNPNPATDAQCLPFFMDAMSCFEQLPPSLDKALFYSDLGQYYLTKSIPEMDKAGHYLRRAEQELQPFKEAHSRTHFFILNALGRYSFLNHAYEDSLAYFTKAEEVLTFELDEANKKAFLVRQYLYLGRSYDKLGNAPAQVAMMEEATKAAEYYAVDMGVFSNGVGL